MKDEEILRKIELEKSKLKQLKQKIKEKKKNGKKIN